MDKEFEVFKKPAADAKIWRYMDFTKFVSTLNKSALHFSRMDLLEDKFEGSLPKSFYAKPSAKGNNFFRQMVSNFDKRQKEMDKIKKQIDKISSKINKANRQFAFINSWHVNEFESAAMWQLYLKSTEGIAFQSTFRRLNDSVTQKENVQYGLIYYVDNYGKESDFMNFFVNDMNFYHVRFPFMFKRMCFEHEKELRAIVLTGLATERAKKEYVTKLAVSGIPDHVDIEVKLDTLIEKIIVSPNAEKWFEDLVRSVVEKYGFNLKIERSSLADDPIF